MNLIKAMKLKRCLTESLRSISQDLNPQNLKKNGYINFRLPDVEYIYDEEGRLRFYY